LQNILTDAYLYDDDVLNDINIFVAQLFESLAEINVTLEPDVQIVLERMESADALAECGYYFVNHKARCLFWHEDFDINYLLLTVKGADCPRHISSCGFMYHSLINILFIFFLSSELEIEAQYWSHWELFPNAQVVTQPILDELKDIILYSSIGQQLFPTFA
jgi:hypothetical protein